jgi:hypothetical protein
MVAPAGTAPAVGDAEAGPRVENARRHQRSVGAIFQMNRRCLLRSSRPRFRNHRRRGQHNQSKDEGADNVLAGHYPLPGLK